MELMSFTIGIDFGGVLSKHDKSSIDSGEHINTVIDMPYAVDVLKTLHKEGHSLNIISFCGRRRAYESLQSLADNKLSCLFTTQHYVKDRLYKAHICAYIGCHIMIDDRVDILDNIKNNFLIHIQFGLENQNHICNIALII